MQIVRVAITSSWPQPQHAVCSATIDQTAVVIHVNKANGPGGLESFVSSTRLAPSSSGKPWQLGTKTNVHRGGF